MDRDSVFALFLMGSFLVQIPFAIRQEETASKSLFAHLMIILVGLFLSVLVFSGTIEDLVKSGFFPFFGLNDGGVANFLILIFTALLVPVPALRYIGAGRSKLKDSSSPDAKGRHFPWKASFIICFLIIAASPILLWLEFGVVLLGIAMAWLLFVIPFRAIYQYWRR